MKQITKANSILPGATNDGFWLDIADLFVHGDQFLHNDIATEAMGVWGPVFALPGADLNARYPDETMINGLFKEPDTAHVFHQDGVMRMNILGTIHDTTPRGSVMGLTI